MASWDDKRAPQLDLMRRVREHFDPAGVCIPGVFAGGL